MGQGIGGMGQGTGCMGQGTGDMGRGTEDMGYGTGDRGYGAGVRRYGAEARGYDMQEQGTGNTKLIFFVWCTLRAQLKLTISVRRGDGCLARPWPSCRLSLHPTVFSL